MTTALVVYASRMGSTAEIAAAVGRRLRQRGIDTTLTQAQGAPSPAAFDVAVVGSAIYLGHWMPAAQRYLARHALKLAARPTFLFQSGPCGTGADAELVETNRRVAHLTRQIGAEELQTFGGRLDRDHARGPLSDWMASGALAGDFRDWDAIERWADHIASSVQLISARTP